MEIFSFFFSGFCVAYCERIVNRTRMESRSVKFLTFSKKGRKEDQGRFLAINGVCCLIRSFEIFPPKYRSCFLGIVFPLFFLSFSPVFLFEARNYAAPFTSPFFPTSSSNVFTFSLNSFSAPNHTGASCLLSSNSRLGNKSLQKSSLASLGSKLGK